MSLRKRILRVFGTGSSCHGGQGHKSDGRLPRIVVVGNPNVGKSVVFNCLTGARATVSNYPGTTVNVFRGKARIGDKEAEVMDTPGMYSLVPITEEERIARQILLKEKLDVILHVVDGRNLVRMLPFTLQLVESGFPVILDLNMMDEAEAAGIKIDVAKLENELGIPVTATVATNGRGIETLRKRLVDYVTNGRAT